MTKNYTIVLLSILVLIMAGFIALVLPSYKDSQKEVLELQEKQKQVILKDQRLQTMTKALMVVYGLSKWEAHYYSIIFDDFSQEYGTPWEIYPAIVRVESNFKCTSVSTKSAKGIMQVMEPTAEMIAPKIEMSYVKGETLWNDFCNMVLGCYYLSDNIKAKGLDGGVQCYLGGPAYLKSAKASVDVFKYLGEYKTTVGKEYKTLSYMYRGIVAESGYDYSKIHTSTYSDSITINIELFK